MLFYKKNIYTYNMRINKKDLIFLIIVLMNILNNCDSEGAKDWFKNKINKIHNKTRNLFSDNQEHLSEYHDEHSHSHHHRTRDNHYNHHNHHHHHDQNHDHEHNRRTKFNPIVSLDIFF